MDIIIPALSGLVGSLLTAGGMIITGRRGHQATESQTLINGLQKRVNGLEARVDMLEGKRREDALLIRRMGDHIDTLESHIRDELGPPPPPRPEGV